MIFKFNPKKNIKDGALRVIKLFSKTGKIKNYKDDNYYNIKKDLSLISSI